MDSRDIIRNLKRDGWFVRSIEKQAGIKLR